MAQSQLSVYNGATFIKREKVSVRQSPKTGFLAYYLGKWQSAYVDSWGNLAIDLGAAIPATIPATIPAKRPRKPQSRPQLPQTATETAHSGDPLDYAWETGQCLYVAPATPYEAWKAGKLGHGPKVTAPRGKGRMWADRLYCERAIERAKTPPLRPQKRQLRTGSKESRRQGQRKAARLSCWSYGLEIAEAVYNSNIRCYGAENVDWETVREIVSEAFGYTSCMLKTYVD